MITQQGCPDNNSQPPNGYEPDPWEFCCECGGDILDTVTGDWLDEAMVAYQAGGDPTCGECMVKKHHSVALLAIARMTEDISKLKADLQITQDAYWQVSRTKRANEADHDRIEKLERMARAYCKFQNMDITFHVASDGEISVACGSSCSADELHADLRTAIDIVEERQYPE